ncbi:TRAP transporter substrate-binding protein [Rehaibacterium terrae]|jgi:TRAP-type mannitol/chloroaromatic compound transport system substrate-binding protein|uniref:TRAP-type mannitol/chloroaromatic compound transport system substrate-binding protein n=1 Tax=Rehaibacterium terrae TaxID=1341696 RepID=A0A7W7V6M2_9GAMM|nr:TRAP transporter substrate-binding protein DctP [Rehaibacterium terrae]MBB5014215.1 TRAP-type mannitol/chloroaromatic compound transport system substrate-binding protein [Rehaibacterium terrae]
MKRRDLLRGTGLAAVAAGLAACGAREGGSAGTASDVRLSWKMVTSWPANLPGLGTGAALLGEMITRASGGRLRVRVYGAGELVPAFEVFDAVSRGTAEMGHTASYYWKGKAAAAPFFCAIPFGFNAQEMNGWLYEGGGLALWRELYAQFGLVPFPAGNTGVQMAGWFNRELRSLADLRGLKMRIPGLGGEVMAKVGATPVNLPGAEIFTALQSGAIDACEWVGPYNDLAFGLHRVAKFYYYPGWQEPGPTLECMVNKTAFEALPDDLKHIVETCCRAVNDAMLAEYTARNQQALDQLVREHNVQLRRLPDDVIAALRRASEETLEAMAAADPFVRRVYDSQRAFRAQAQAWHAISEEAYYAARR